MTWRQTITVECLKDEKGFTLYCEPEGADHEVRPGDVLVLTFSGPEPYGFEVAPVKDGLILCRLGGGDVEIVDKRGRDLRW